MLNIAINMLSMDHSISFDSSFIKYNYHIKSKMVSCYTTSISFLFDWFIFLSVMDHEH